MSELSQTNSELAIFRRFLEATQLPVLTSSLQKRQPPEPDILCEIIDSGFVAFELVEVVDEGFASMVNGQIRLERTLHQAVGHAEPAQRGRLLERFADALIYVRYLEPRVRRRERAIPALLRYLMDLPPGVEGDIHLGAETGLGEIRSIRITRGDYPPGPHFQVQAVSSIADPVVECVRNKWAKQYDTRHRTELLAYYQLHPATHPSFWLDDLRAFIDDKWHISPFSRVWVLDASEPEVLLDLSRPTPN
jgi:hypothetical protein